MNLYTKLDTSIGSFGGFNKGSIILDNFSVLNAIRSLKLGVYFDNILCIFAATTEHRKLVYGKLMVTFVMVQRRGGTVINSIYFTRKQAVFITFR